MKAPNKIYVEVCEDGIFSFPEPPFKESVEYIRADLVEQSLQQEQPEVQNGKFVFPKYLYARTKDNKTIDMSYAPQDMTAVEYVRNDFVEQEQQEVDLEKEYQEFCKDYPFPWSSQYVNSEYLDELCLSIARHFYKLGLQKLIADKQVEELRGQGSGPDYNTTEGRFRNAHKFQQEQPGNMIQWTGNNLKEVIDFTGKSPRFGEWFNSWEEYENYVHTHNFILKLFSDDGSHFEVPVGAWIVKTPDGYNVPSVARFIHAKQEQPEVELDAIVNEAFDKYSSVDGYGQLVVSFNRAELYSFIKKIARKEE